MVYCHYSLYVIFSTNPVRRSEKLCGDPVLSGGPESEVSNVRNYRNEQRFYARNQTIMYTSWININKGYRKNDQYNFN